MGAAARKAKPRSASFVGWEKVGQESHPFVRCTDGRRHRYLTADHRDLSEHPPTSIDQTPAACPSCGLSMSELKGRTVRICSECQWDAIASHIQEFAEESGIMLMPPPPDHVQLRMRCRTLNPMGMRRGPAGNRLQYI